MAGNPQFAERILEANRVLIDLDAIDCNRSLSLTAINTIRNARRLLAELWEMKADRPVSRLPNL